MRTESGIRLTADEWIFFPPGDPVDAFRYTIKFIRIKAEEIDGDIYFSRYFPRIACGYDAIGKKIDQESENDQDKKTTGEQTTGKRARHSVIDFFFRSRHILLRRSLLLAFFAFLDFAGAFSFAADFDFAAFFFVFFSSSQLQLQ